MKTGLLIAGGIIIVGALLVVGAVIKNAGDISREEEARELKELLNKRKKENNNGK